MEPIRYKTRRNVEVSLSEGLARLGAYHFSKECEKYPNDIMLVYKDQVVCPKNFKDMLKLKIEKGSLVHILVEDLPETDEQAILERLETGLKTPGKYPEFGMER